MCFFLHLNELISMGEMDLLHTHIFCVQGREWHRYHFIQIKMCKLCHFLILNKLISMGKSDNLPKHIQERKWHSYHMIQIQMCNLSQNTSITYFLVQESGADQKTHITNHNHKSQFRIQFGAKICDSRANPWFFIKKIYPASPLQICIILYIYTWKTQISNHIIVIKHNSQITKRYIHQIFIRK